MIGELCALGAAFSWSLSVVLFKRSESIGAQGMNLFKNVAAVLLLAVTLPVLGEGIDWQRSSADWWALVVSGVLGIAIADTLVFMALGRLGAGLLAVVECAYAPCVVALSVLFLAETPGPGFAAGAVLVVGGVGVATSERHPTERSAVERLPARERWVGVVLGVAGVVAMAVSIVVAKPALGRGGLVEVMLVRLVAGVAGQMVWMAVAPSQRRALQALKPSPAWRTLVPASLLGSYLSMMLWLAGFKWAAASTASVLNQLAAVFTMVMARVLLGEPLSGRRALGGAVAVAGAVLVILRA